MQSTISLAVSPLSLLQAQARYGEINNGVWGHESLWCKLLELPLDLQFPHWVNSLTGFEVSHIYCNVDFAPHLLAALSNVKNRGLGEELKTFDGCFELRDQRGYPGCCSAHSYGIAIDINAFENPLGHPTSMNPEFVKCWTDAGLVWGGSFKRCDSMHFSLGF